MSDYREQASFYRAALLLGLLPGSLVVRWADTAIDRDVGASAAFIEIAATPPTDITSLRHALLQLCEEKPSEMVMRALFGLVERDLASGRRSLRDTMTVIRQIRGFLRLSPTLNDQLRSLGVDFALASRDGDTTEFERRLYDWLQKYAGAERTLMSFSHE